jgi:hypothetical protein
MKKKLTFDKLTLLDINFDISGKKGRRKNSKFLTSLCFQKQIKVVFLLVFATLLLRLEEVSLFNYRRLKNN